MSDSVETEEQQSREATTVQITEERVSTGGNDDTTGISLSTTRRMFSSALDDDDDLGSSSSYRSSRLTSRYSSNRYGLDDDDLGSSALTSRYASSRFRSSYLDDDDLSASSSRSTRLSRYARDADDDYASTYSSSRYTSRYASALQDDDDLGSSYSRRAATRLTSSYLSRNDDDDDFDRLSTSSRHSRYSTSRRLTSDLADSLYRVSSPGLDDDDALSTTSSTRRYQSQYSIDSLNEDSGSSSIRRRYQSSRSVSRTEPKDAGQVYEAILDYKPPRAATDEISLKEGQEVIVLDKQKPHKWLVRTRKSKNFIRVEEGYAPSAYLKATNETVEVENRSTSQEPSDDNGLSTGTTPAKDDAAIQKDLKKKKDMIVKELIETEEDLVRDMQLVQRTYIRQSESAITPKEIKAVKDQIFSCYKDLLNFHSNHLLKNFQTLSKEPAKIGTLFLRMEEQFEDHTKYCKNLSKALEILDENSEVADFFANYAVKVRDDKSLADHLKLPYQRISDYQLLLKEISKHLARMGENVDDLEKAIKMVGTIPNKGADDDDELANKNIPARPDSAAMGEKLSDKLKSVLQTKGYVDVVDSMGKTEERFVFLFKTRIFIADVNKNAQEGQRAFETKQIIQLEDIDVELDSDKPNMLIVKSKDLSNHDFPIGLKCKTIQQAREWYELMTREPEPEADDSIDMESVLREETLTPASPQPPTPQRPDSRQSESQQTLQEKVDFNNNKLKNMNLNLVENGKTESAQSVVNDNQAQTPKTGDSTHSSSFSFKTASRKESLTKEEAEEIKKLIQKQGEKMQKSKIRIIEPLRAVTRHWGEMAVFQCQIQSETPTNVQWLKDNRIVSGNNFRTSKKNNNVYVLELMDLCPDDAGLYTFVASNSKDTVSCCSTLNVLSADSRPTSPGGSFLPHPPKFKVKLKDTDLREGTTVRFELIVRGLPIPQLTFYKNDMPLKEDDHLRIVYQSKEVFEIVFDNIKQSDAGRYKVRAVNPEGEDMTEAQITVSTTKDVFWGLPQDAMEQAAIEEARARSSSRAHSPAFKWFRDGREFEASERFQVQYDTEEDNIVLIFQHVKPEDAGLYTCVASTSSSKITCSAELTVQGVVKQLDKPPMKPEIIKQLTDVKTTVGENVCMLEAQVAGFPRPKMVWTRNGQEIVADDRHKLLLEGEENFALLIKNVQEDDAGKYKLKAVNELGQAETEAQLTVCKRPKVHMIQDKIEIMEQEDLVIKIQYEAVPAPKILWLKDGVEIKDSLKRVKTGQDETEASLLIQKASIQDAGLYTCQVSNDLGSSQAAAEAVVNSSPKFLKRMESLEILEDEQATFEVIVSNSTPKAQIEWFYGTKKLEATDKIKMFEEANGRYLLTILKGKKDDSGKYRCKTKNPYGGEECEAQLTVKRLEDSKPQFTQTLKDIEVKLEETNVKFEVATSGEPKPVLKWFHNGEALTAATKGVKIQDTPQGSSLVIEKVTATSHGQYVCQAESVAGKSETAANLVVVGPPYVVKPLEDQGQPLEAQVKLSAIIKGNPQPEVVWYCNDKQVKLEPNKRVAGYDEASGEYHLTIFKLANEDIGDYRLAAKNKFGACQTEARIDVVAKPLFTKVLKNVQCQLMETNIEFVVQLDKQDAKTLVKWFKDDQEIKAGDSRFKMAQESKDNSYKLTVLKATEETVGKFKAQACNDCGIAETSARLDILKAPQILEGLQDMNVKEGESVTMRVLIDACPAPEVVLLKDGQQAPVKMTAKPAKNDRCFEYEAQLVGVKQPDGGVWLCRATNVQGVAESKATLLVQSAPAILQDLADAQVGQGQEIALKLIIANSEPSPAVKWLKNGAPVQLGARARVEQPQAGEHILKIADAMESDAGVYQALVESPLGVAQSKQAKIQVADKLQAPKFVKRIEDAVVVVEDSVRFEAKIEANPAADVTWYRDGTPLKVNERVAIKQEDGSNILILRHLTIKDSGVITCKATNPAGSVTDTANLDVHEPTLPTITGLRDYRVIEGEPFKLVANVTGFPRPFVSWFLDGVEIDSDIVYSEPQNNLYTLNFKSFALENAGEYTCRAANSAGQALEQCQVLIGGAKPHFIKELAEDITMSVGKENGKLKIGQAAIFETIVVGAPMPTVTWLKNDVPLKNTERVVITTPEEETSGEHRMEIKNITKDDVASYTCKAVNQYGEAQSICLLKYLNEPHPPIIKKPLENVKIEEGEQLTLMCKVDGEPMPSVKWFKNDKPLESNDEHMKIISSPDGGTKLVIDSATMADAAKYEVKVENVKGSVATSSTVTVVKPQRPPKFMNPLPEEVKVEFNSPIILEAQIFGLPTPSILWAKDGKPITDSTPRVKLSEVTGPKEGDKLCKLEITHGKQEDIGLYTLKASNPNGEALGETHVKVQPEPQAPLIVDNLPVKVQVVEGEPLELHAKVQAYPLPEVKWAHNNVPINESDQRVQIIVKPDGNLTLKIDPAAVGDSGVFSLTVSNPVGEVAITTKVEIAPKGDSKDIKKPEEDQASKKKIEEVKKAPEEAKVEDVQKKPTEQATTGHDDDDASKKKGDGDASKKTTDDDTSGKSRKESLPKNLSTKTPDKHSELESLDNDKQTPIDQQKRRDSSKPEDAKLSEDSGKLGRQDSSERPKSVKRKSTKKKSVKKDEEPMAGKQKSMPVVLQGLSDQSVPKDAQVKLTAIIKGEPEPEIIWYHNDVPVKLDKKNFVTNHDEASAEYSLTILKFTDDDTGEYRLEARNELGVCSTKANIDLVDKSVFESPTSLGRQDSVPGAHRGTGPFVVKGLSDQGVPKDAQAKLTAIIKGEPEPEIIWYRNDVPVKIDKKNHITNHDEASAEYSLTILKFTEDDTGEYRLEARNKLGVCSTKANVDLVDKSVFESPTSLGRQDSVPGAHRGTGPFVVKGLSNQTVPKDTQAKLTAIIKGEPEPEIIWYRDDVPVKIDKKNHITNHDEASAEYSLTILKFTDDDAGEYRLEARNELGVCSTKANVDLVDKSVFESPTSLGRQDSVPGAHRGTGPFVVKGLSDQGVPKDAQAKLTAIIKGEPEPEIIWYRNDVPVKIDKKNHITNYDEASAEYSLTILKFTDDDAGEYRLEARNKLGVCSTKANVDLVDKSVFESPTSLGRQDSVPGAHRGTGPVVIKGLSNQTVPKNTQVKLTAIIKGEPEPEIIWYRNDVPVKVDKKNFVTNYNEASAEYSLTILKFTDDDAGEYRLEARNKLGVCSTKANVDLVDKSVFESPSSLGRQDSVPGAHRGTGPFVIKGLSNQSVPKDTQVKLTAIIKGEPEPEIIWYCNDVPVKIDKKNHITNYDEASAEYSLTILKFIDDDAGEYRLEARNEFGVCFTKANIDLVDKSVFVSPSSLGRQDSVPGVHRGTGPFVIKGLSNQTVPKDTQVKLTAVIKGNPEPKVVWFCNDKPIKVDKQKYATNYDETSAEYCLTIFKFEENDAGEYRLEAKNDYGSCSTEARLELVERVIENKVEDVGIQDNKFLNRQGFGPYVVKHLQHQQVPKDTEVKLTAIIKGQPEPDTVWYHNDVPIKLAGNRKFQTNYDETAAEYTLTIFKFENDNVGEYRLEAKNEFGACFTKGLLTLFDKVYESVGKIDESDTDSLLDRTRALLDQSQAIFDRNVEILEQNSDVPLEDKLKPKQDQKKDDQKSVKFPPKSEPTEDKPAQDLLKQELPSEVTVKPGEPLTLEAKIQPVSGDKTEDKPNVVWKKDGVPLDGSTGEQIIQTPSGDQILKIPDPNKSDGGKYSLVVENPDKKEVQITSSDVQVLPQNDNQMCFEKSLPAKVNLTPDEAIDLKLAVRSPQEVKDKDVKVFKDDKPVDKVNDVIVSIKNTPQDTQEISLKKDKLGDDDTGLYRVEITIPNMETLSTECSVNIIDKQEAAVEVPKILSGLKPIEIESGQAGKLQLKVEGDARNLDVAWFKDGEQIVPNEQFGIIKLPDGTIALQIDSFAAGDAGEYSVQVKNSQGGMIQDSTSANLKKDKTASMPVIVQPLKSVEVDEGSPLVLSTKVAAPGSFKAAWFFDGKPLTERDGLKFLITPDGVVALQIDKASMGDSGKYSVKISNDAGAVSSDGTATVKPGAGKNLQVLRGLESSVFTVGKSGELELQISGPVDGLDIKFLKNGSAIVPSDRVHIRQLPDGVVRLTLDCVELDDAGDYSVIISAPGSGQVQSKCQVQVKSKPIITKHLVDLEVKEGCTAKFEIQVEANPPADIKWMMNGRSLGSKSQAVASSGPNGTYYLTIDKCSFRDEAVYSVAVSNELGTEKSEGKLHVIGEDKFKESAPGFLNGLSDVTFKQGDTITLEADILGHPSPTLTWCKNGIPIGNDERFTTFFDGSHAVLTITNAESSDVGQYSLTVSNKLGEATSKANAALQANTAPKFVKKLVGGEHKLKEDLKLTCRAEGFPDPHIRWTFNGVEIQSGPKYSIFTEANGDLSLTIFNPTEFDSGVFECVASNSAGSDKTSANLQFADKYSKGEAAAFIKKLTDYDVLPGETAYFTGCVVGSPHPELTWFFNGSPLDISGPRFTLEYNENGMFKLEIRDVTEADLGKYQCRASNVYGTDNSISQLSFEKIGLDRSKSTHKSMKSQARAESVELKTGGMPDALTDSPQIAKMTDESLTLIWSPSIPEKPRFPVSYVVEFGKAKDGVWMIYSDKIRDNKCEVTGLEKFTDYNFRVRVENKFGKSDPSPTVLAERSQLKHDDYAHKPREFKPEDYNIDHKERGHVAAAPKFLREEPNSMFGIVGQPVTIEFWVHGFPDPDIQWFYGDRLLEKSDIFSFLHDRNGRVCLFINKMSGLDAGDYTCVARNEHGEARQTIRLVEASAPVFTRKLEEMEVQSRGHARLEVAFEGTPECTIKWFKDFKPLHDTGRATVLKTGDSSSLALSELMVRDSGLYSCTITNLAGSSTTSAYLKVTDAGVTFDRFPSQYHSTVKAKNKTVESLYDLGDELGRGTQGITYHAVERDTGKSYAAKMMHGIGETRKFMQQELDMMNQLGAHERLVQLRDAFAATPHAMTLITDLCGGGPLLDHVLNGGQLTEAQVADYMKQLLEGLHTMHMKNIGHFGLTIGDLLLDRLNGWDLKIADFGLSARVIPGMTHFVEYGHPEFVAPEIVDKTTVTFGADIWSSGIVAHIMLTGVSPFLGENDRATLQNIKDKKGLDLSDDALKNISTDGRDFLRKTLNWEPSARPDTKTLLGHPWFRSARQQTSTLDVIQSLRTYQSKYNKWYENASCKRYYRRRALHSCYTHPSRMIYPPDEQYSPVVSPDRELKKFQKPTASPFDNIYPASNRPDSEPFSSESHYQSGPETYLLQLRDTGFPTRIRRYLRIAASSSPSIAASLSGAHWGSNIRSSLTGYTPTVSIKERRKFTDVMDEEVTEEWRGNSFRNRPSRLLREVGTSAYAYGQMNTLRREVKFSRYGTETPDNAKAPFFREKFRDCTFRAGEEIVVSCFAVGVPEPSYTWFRNESILIESSRIQVRRTADGRCELILKPTREYDAGLYKCIARNVVGQAVARARISLGDVPDHLHAPQASDISSNSILLTWSSPKFINAALVKSYKLEMRQASSGDWTTVNNNIRQEFYIVDDLTPETDYYFRITATNCYGQSEPGPSSELIRTTNESKTIGLPVGMQIVCDDIEESTKQLDYSRETAPVALIASDYKEIYDFKSLITTGKFSAIARAHIKDGTRATLACKCVLIQSEQESGIANEYNIMKTLAHERIVKLVYAHRDSQIFSLAMELTSGLNILTYLCRKTYYSEENVSLVISQVLDAIEYLHFRGLALIELQPDNVLVCDERRLQIKLCDFAKARPVKGPNAVKIDLVADPEFIAPEIVKSQEAYTPYTDIWTVGVLAYILLSGYSPFKGADQKETGQNVAYVRYLFERLYPEVTQDAIRFILSVFKLTPHKRPTIEELNESKWLLPGESLLRRREIALFNTTRLRNYTQEFLSAKQLRQSRLVDLLGVRERDE